MEALSEAAAEATVECKEFLSREQLDEYFQQFKNADAAAECLAKILELPDYIFDARSSIKLDFCTYVLEFSKEMRFGYLRTSSVLEVAMNVFEVCVAGGGFEEAQATLRVQLLQLTVPQPAEDDQYFSPDYVAKIAQFMARTFFRHYTLYSHVFSHLQEHDHHSTELLVEEPEILPFELALTQNEFEAYEAEKVAAAEAAQQAAEEAERARIEAEQKAVRDALEQEALERRKAELEKRPSTLEEAVEHAVACYVEEEKTRLATVYKQKEDVYIAKITELQTQLAAATKKGPS